MQVVTVLDLKGTEKHKGLSFIICRFFCRILNIKEIEFYEQQINNL